MVKAVLGGQDGNTGRLERIRTAPARRQEGHRLTVQAATSMSDLGMTGGFVAMGASGPSGSVRLARDFVSAAADQEVQVGPGVRLPDVVHVQALPAA